VPDYPSQFIQCIGHSFTDAALLKLALTHRSYGSVNNERLEFLGDSIVNFLIAEALFTRFPEAKEGDLSRMRAQLVKGVTLAEIAREFNLGDHLNLGSGEMKSGGFRRESILADAVEAIIGAIYLDAGMDVCRRTVLGWYQSRLNEISPDVNIKDAKTQLQEFLQSRKKALPKYQLVQTTGSEHAQQFEVQCLAAGLTSQCVGVGSNRRSAEQAAATQALKQLQVVK
jgi:ribonuclease-3